MLLKCFLALSILLTISCSINNERSRMIKSTAGSARISNSQENTKDLFRDM